MQSIHYLMLAQVALAFFAAFYLTRKLRGFIRASVVRLMPVKHRISDESFNMQTRISTLVAYLIGLAFTGLIYWGIDQLSATIRPTQETQQQIVDLSPSIPEPTLPTIPEPKPEVLPEAETVSPPPVSAPKVAVPTVITEYEEPTPRTGSMADAHYIQLYAFNSADRAVAQRFRYEQLLSRPVRVVPLMGTIGPYKVVVGPFASQLAAREFKYRTGLEGTVLPKSKLGLY